VQSDPETVIPALAPRAHLHDPERSFATPGTGNAAVRIINATTRATAGSGSYDIYVNPTATPGAPNASAIGRTNQSSYLVGPAG